MRIDDASNMDIRRSNSLRSLDNDELLKKSNRSAAQGPAVDQAASSAQRGLLALALQVGDPSSSSRVEELRSAISSGTYRVDAAEVSRSMVDAALNRD